MSREGPLVDHWHEVLANQASGTGKPRYQPAKPKARQRLQI